MLHNKLIESKLKKFVEEFSLDGESDRGKLKRFLNYHFFSQFQPGRLDTDSDMFDLICIDSPQFPGIQGAAVLLNGQLISTAKDIDDILQKDKKGEFTFCFLTMTQDVSFVHQIEEILDSQINQSKQEEWLKNFAYALSEEVVLRWKDSPCLNLVYYVEKTAYETEVTAVENSEGVKTVVSDIVHVHLDEKKLLDIINSNEKSYQGELENAKFYSIPQSDAYIGYVSGPELLNLISTPERLLRRNMFDDNVRDSQGYSGVNLEILETLRKNPELFVLYNNGITIVCRKFDHGKLENPQIVNGCQTCSMLYQASREPGVNLEKVQVVVKVVESNDENRIQGIVRGANRQNIVYEEAFETVREFHKNLEKYFETHPETGFPPIYYERRSRQYADNVHIKPQQRISFRALIQSMTALFLNHVENSHMHESRLLALYHNSLFVDSHSYEPYYLAAFLYLKTDQLFRSGKLPGELKSFKMHIMLLIKELNAGPAPELSSDDIDEYCKHFFELLQSKGVKVLAEKACEEFKLIQEKWGRVKGDSYRYGIKDSAEFREFLMKEIYGTYVETSVNEDYTGYILNVKLDKHNNFYGFIERSPRNIYFSEFENEGIDRSYIGKKVSYKINRAGNRERATNIRILNTNEKE